MTSNRELLIDMDEGYAVLKEAALDRINEYGKKIFAQRKTTFIEQARQEFYDLQSHYNRSITHGGFETTRVTRDGKRYEVSNYADAGPFELWVIQRAVESVVSFADWEKFTKVARCPRLK